MVPDGRYPMRSDSCFSFSEQDDYLFTMAVTLPGPVIQKLNTLLHREPFSTIAYCIYWSIFLAFWTPIAIVYLQIGAVAKLLSRYWKAGDVIDPCRNKDHELAVFITGCDSGIGKELALWASDAGFVVFAGCLQESSQKQLNDLFPNLIPVKLDVTSDQDVTNAVKNVSDWIENVSSENESNKATQKKKRSLHALINNAGVASGGEVDWISLADFQKCMDGKQSSALR
jgi:hypothetical protein